MTIETPTPGPKAFGANAWLVDDLYQRFLDDKQSVDQAWWDFFEDYRPSSQRLQERAQPATTPEPAPTAPDTTASPAAVRGPVPVARPEPLRPDDAPHRPRPVDLTSDQAPAAAAEPAIARYTSAEPRALTEAGAVPDADQIRVLKGAPMRTAVNMETSLGVPTATSIRQVPAKVMIENRGMINNQLARSRGGRISFTHLIAFAMAEAMREMPEMNAAYGQEDGKPALIQHAHVNLGLAIDLKKPDGTRQLLVPAIKRADTLTFAELWAGYEDLVRRARVGKLTVDDLAGVTCSLTNPGGIGTSASVPRLMPGQSVIVGVGAMEYPAEFQGTAQVNLSDWGISKLLTLTSTYDHRVIQGAQSGEFLRLMHRKLLGEDGFYDRIFASLRIPYEPIRWEQDTRVPFDQKTSAVTRLIHGYRVRGHMAADIDPLAYRQRGHEDLLLSSYGLSIWDMERVFNVGGFGGHETMKLTDIIQLARDTYCGRIGVEYMHIEDPVQRQWLQDRLERPTETLGRDVQLRALSKLNEAEALETFLQTKYVGAKRFSLEGSEAVVPVLDAMISRYADQGTSEVVIGMAHRGRLNVLTNVAGKSYGQVFTEFEDNPNARDTYQGSGDVKYHLGTEGVFRSPAGNNTQVYLAANPSHLEAADGVVEGIARAKQDRLNLGPDAAFAVVPVLIHGDAAFAGQGVVMETLNLHNLRGYRTGGTIHLIINNQVGFTVGTVDSRSTQYATDVAKGYGCPIFHVNGDDPEACIRATLLAAAFRDEFQMDVVVDLVSYRRRGHNEGDDPSMTQPVMYSFIDKKRSVRKLYTEALISRGDLTIEDAEQSLKHFQSELERAFTETRQDLQAKAEANAGSPAGAGDPGVIAGAGAGGSGAGESGAVAARGWAVAETSHGLELPASQREDAGVLMGWKTSISPAVVERVGQVFVNPPAGFTVHPKLKALLNKRATMAKEGGIDWGMAEMLAFGSLLLEDIPVRLTGQDSRRGTFAHRHVTFHDKINGAEWTPLWFLSDHQAKVFIYDSALSEYAIAAFEYGYSVERPDALVLWEAQFGDFFNGAQTVADEFVSSAEQKWGQHSSVVYLLPHGYEGQGPDHSSARIERFLALCAEDNLRIAQPTSPANYAHLLRLQAYTRPRKPLIVFTPKSGLRRKEAVSSIDEFTTGTYQPVLLDALVAAPAARRVLLCSGRIYWDLLARRAKLDEATQASTAIIRLEQLYPLTQEMIDSVLDGLPPDATLIWVQDEPANQGAWSFLLRKAAPMLGGRALDVVSRPEAASPATGSHSQHAREQEALLEQAFRS
ncbi:MAG: multifunctional oxoglutarate decarboxylase/oxoglutarate dehydrogenase thiamine pyrophosphate-binding subunit/dihydrolipoyllysine-residue succinyltransferase subunit [Bifidobacteriaceae bacterium]|nr:multifunctional oxoglutarate decarboxylase/oxoglutarate dehydrogenase thiamine pyrophosphate-binding subunit/dihydrolipoyllysine-residue succinyltransferase subunit [Bifidobacteriaceae bacterium]